MIASGLNCLILAILITKRVGSPGWVSLGWSCLRISFASLLMAIAVIVALHTLPQWLPLAMGTTKLALLLRVGIGISLGIVTYAIAVAAFCRSECRTLRSHSAS